MLYSHLKAISTPLWARIGSSGADCTLPAKFAQPQRLAATFCATGPARTVGELDARSIEIQSRGDNAN